ncbi:hypothetical protein ACFWIA_11005 [Streptomyces sp. NPDC127068]|uniref:hypothetical protein n=1 Tax=Streptomyces sp. NPDC127068 TaxID=3347127 RepID=UPI00365BB285
MAADTRPRIPRAILPSPLRPRTSLPPSTPDPASGDRAAPSTTGPLSSAEARRRTVRTVLAVYAAATAAHLTALFTLTSATPGAGVRERLLSWDGQLYAEIAADGYPDEIAYGADGEPLGNNLAFFPLYPLLVRTLHRTTGLDVDSAALLVAHLAFLGALFAVHALVTSLYGRRTADVTLVLVAVAQPMAVALVMAYSEALFLALAAGALLAARRGNWLAAGALGLLAGLTRPAAGALALALAVAVLGEVRRARRLGWRPLVGLVLACTGTPAYLLWVAERTGQLDGWFVIQEAGWGTHWDSGAATVDFLTDTLARGDGWVPLSTAFLLVAACALTVVAWRRGAWPPLLVYGTAMLVMTLGQSNFYHSKLRLLVPALLLLVPLAAALSRLPRRRLVLVLSAGAVFGAWYGAHMLVVWKYAV